MTRVGSLAASHHWLLVDVTRKSLQAVQDTLHTRLFMLQSTAPAAQQAIHYPAAPHSIAAAHTLAGWLHVPSYNREARMCTFASPQQREGADIRHLHPKLQRQWNYDRNAHLGSVVVTPGSRKKAWWTCDQCPDGKPHVWEATVNSRTQGNNCPFCSNRQPCQHNSLASKAPAIAAQFSNKNPDSPEHYTVGSNRKVLWQCELGHEWVAPISRRACNKSGCPSCYNARRSSSQMQHPVLTDSQHPMMQHWDWERNTKTGLDPSEITCRSAKKAHWICLQCPSGQPHRWQAAVGDVFRGSRCPCCSGRKACICNSLQSLAPQGAAEWDYTKNKGTPSDYTAGSEARRFWYNDKRGSFQAIIKSRTHVRRPQSGN